MNYEDFKNRYLGTQIDVDGFPPSQPYQCTDLAQVYARECWGLSTAPFLNKTAGYDGGGAADAVESWGIQGNFIRDNDADLILNDSNDPNQVPKQGDIVVFSRTQANGWAGHIAIVDSAPVNQNLFISIDQNAPIHSVQYVKHVYDNSDGKNFGSVLGWIRKKEVSLPIPPTAELPPLMSTQPTQETLDKLKFAINDDTVYPILEGAIFQDENALVSYYADRVNELRQKQIDISLLHVELDNLHANPKVVFQEDPAKDSQIKDLTDKVTTLAPLGDEVIKLKSKLENAQKQLAMVNQTTEHPELLIQVQTLQNEILDLQVKNKGLTDENQDWKTNSLVKTVTQLGHAISTPDLISQQIASLLYKNDILALLEKAYYGYVYKQQVNESKKEVVNVKADVAEANTATDVTTTQTTQITATSSSLRPVIVRLLANLAISISSYLLIKYGINLNIGDSQVSQLADFIISLLLGLITHLGVFQWQSKPKIEVKKEITGVVKSTI